MKNARFESSPAAKSIQSLSTLAGGILIVFVLHAGRDVLIPFALSVLLAFLLTPSVNWLQRRGLSNPLSIALVTFGVLSMIALGGMMVWSSVSEFATNMPKYRGEIVRKVEFANESARAITNRISKMIVEPKDASPASDNSPSVTEVASVEAAPQERYPESSTSANSFPNIDWQTWAGSAGAIFGPIGNAGLITVFALFLLINRDDLRERFVSVVSRGNYVVTTEAIAEATQRISKYLVAQLILNVSYGFVFGIGLYLIGLWYAPDVGFPSILFLGAMSGLVRFVPYFGAWVGALLPLTVAVAVFPGYGVFFAVLALIVVLEMASNNIAEPWLYGASTGVSSIAIIVAAVFWGWLWGIVGLLLATPLTVCLVVLGRYIPSLRFFVTMLSDEKQVKPDQRIYQRLLAGESHKLEIAMEDEARDRTSGEFLDEVLVPTAKRILRGRNDDDSKDMEFSQTLLETIDTDHFRSLFKSEPRNSMAVVGDDEPKITTLVCMGISSRHPCESMVLNCLKAIVQDSIQLKICQTSSLPEHAIETIAQSSPALVLILCLPPGGMSQTRFWCKSLRDAGYTGTIVVARPGRFRSYDRLLTSLRRSGATAVTTSIAQTIRKLTAISIQNQSAHSSIPTP
jgi:predicted PurR-regulated permease PerM